jgi:hypothetical protein
MSSEDNTNASSTNENEAKEVSLLKQNLKYLLNLLLGKSTPPFLIKWLCYFFLAWDTLLIIFWIIIAVGKSIMNLGAGYVKFVNFGYTFAFLHFISIIGVLLLWRKKLTGFYIFTASNTTMIIVTFFVSNSVSSLEIIAVFFTFISIGLFALNWNKFDYVIRKKEALKNQHNK